MNPRELLYSVRALLTGRLRGKAGRRVAAFNDIFARNAWGSAESVSGLGSEIAFTTPLRAALPDLLRRLGARSILDAACGDCNWLSRVDLAGVSYCGVDIVADLIRRNREKYADPRMRFETLDIVSDAVPVSDLVLCRHCLIHLSNDDARSAIANFCRSGARWLLTTQSPDVMRNADIPSGSFRLVNLELEPFGFPRPLELIEDAPEGSARGTGFLGLWPIEELKKIGY